MAQDKENTPSTVNYKKHGKNPLESMVIYLTMGLLFLPLAVSAITRSEWRMAAIMGAASFMVIWLSLDRANVAWKVITSQISADAPAQTSDDDEGR